MTQNAVQVRREIAGRTLTIETGRMAKQASGSVLVQYGDSVVLVAACTAPPRLEGADFFPLTVDYREKTYAAGKVPGGFFKREGRPTTKEILTMRLTDRSIRPMFPEGYRDEVQVMASVLATDQENDPDVLSMIGAFAALEVSEIPFQGPMGAVRIGHVDGKLVVNPTHSQLKRPDSKLELVVAGTAEAIVMVEAGGNEIDEETMVEALELGHSTAREIAAMCAELREKVGKEKTAVAPAAAEDAVRKDVHRRYRDEVTRALRTKGKHDRAAAIDELRKRVVADHPVASVGDPWTDERARSKREKELKAVFEDLSFDVEREMILAGTRIDGRKTDEIRPIASEVGVLPRVHGSSLFTRGETQALVVTTLGTVEDEQIIDGLYEEEERRKFMLHYNFPPFSVGEVRPIRGTSRRETGHGALAERSLQPVLPPFETFPYTLRVVSDILESNGSSSMASVCGGTLSLMDAGVPIRQPVAGIAMGLITRGGSLEPGSYAILSDIAGNEDHNGDMDFKVAGTQHGITGLQMDIKIRGVNRAILGEALAQAKRGRLFILKTMLQSAGLRAPRASISPFAPRLEQIRINPTKIGAVIGPKGAVIKKLQDEFKVTVEIVDDTGLIHVSGTKLENVQAAIERIRGMTQEPEIGKVYNGIVKSVKEFGAFVELFPGVEGLCHVSEIADGYVKRVTDVVKVGDPLSVKVINIDDAGKIKLSHRAVKAGEPA
ncbi:MAG TPA: polyribonucleotide nucleotidyltransferase [Planctomycetota bacterium]|nr:polyribonucleotide nucleotidyltransferase [Planctomycetota bacterium]